MSGAEAVSAILVVKVFTASALAVFGIVAIGYVTIHGACSLYNYVNEPKKKKRVTFLDYEEVKSEAIVECEEVKSQATVANKDPSGGCILRNRNVESENQRGSTSLPEIKANIVPEYDEISDTTSVTSDYTITSGSSTSTLIEELEVSENIKTWYDMNAEERNAAKCPCCFEITPIQTVYAVCDHPYACKNCAESLSEDYKFCPLCHKKCIPGEPAYRII